MTLSAFLTVSRLEEALASDKIFSDHYEAIARAIKTRVPKGVRIFHANWSDTQYLIGLAPEHQYLVTLDPIYMYSYNPQLYALYRRVSHGQDQNPTKVIADTFGSHYVYASKLYFLPLVNQLKAQKDVSIIFEDQLGALLVFPSK